MSKKHLTIAISLLVLLSMLLAACGGGAEPTPVPAPAAEAPAAEAPAAEAPAAEVQPTEVPAAEAPAAPAPSGDAVTIRWFIGLGAGGNPEEIERETAFVEQFNAKYGDKYNLVMDIVPNTNAYDVLKTQIAAGDVPDIVGPVGIRGLASFEGAWLDLNPFIAASGYDLSDFDPALVDFYKFGTDSQLFLPFSVFPSAIWYNKALFDEAGLEYPPHEWGAPYADGDEWTWDKLRELAMFLTVDGNGNDATMEGFDPSNITQFGYDAGWQDIRADWSHIHAGSFVDEEGNAYVPDVWRTAAKWYYDGMFGDYFIPNDSYVNSDLMAQGNTFGSGNLAMNAVNLWFTCCTEDVQWDVAAVPAYEGTVTSKLHADTFGILKAAKNPQASWEVYSLFMGEFAGDLAAVYGGFPARQSLQADALAGLQERFPGVDFQVFVDGLAYPDNPSHESAMPNFLKATDTYAVFGAKYQSTADLDIDKELDALVVELQKVFDEVQ
jgi:multiple sugar transport system substrate-binding protein